MELRDTNFPVLKRQPGFRDLGAKRLAEATPKEKRNDSGTAKYRYTPVPPDEPSEEIARSPKYKISRAGVRLRESFSHLDLTDKVKQVVGRKRGREEPGDEAEQPVRKAAALGPRLQKSFADLKLASKVKSVLKRKWPREEYGDNVEEAPRKTPKVDHEFWNKYRELHEYHNEMEITNEAIRIAHAYDDDVDISNDEEAIDSPRTPPHVNERALAALEGRTRSRSTSGANSFVWGGERLERIHLFRGLPPPPTIELPPEIFGPFPTTSDRFSWAGEDAEDFMRFLTLADYL